MSTTLLVLLALGTAEPQEEPRPRESRIVEVSVFGGSASVRRQAALPAGDGKFVLAGLPLAMDPASVRVRSDGGEVVGVEVQERLQPDLHSLGSTPRD